MNTEIVKAEDIEQSGPQEMGIFGADPIEAFTKMKELVKHVAAPLKGKQYVVDIQGKKFPTVEWWTTVGLSLGLASVVEWCRKVEDDSAITWEACARVETPTGRIVGRAESQCSNRERTWARRDEYAIRSMAQTRAVAKSHRLCLSALAVMADLSPTPSEEMPRSQGPKDDIDPRTVLPPKPTKPKRVPLKKSKPSVASAEMAEAGYPVETNVEDIDRQLMRMASEMSIKYEDLIMEASYFKNEQGEEFVRENFHNLRSKTKHQDVPDHLPQPWQKSTYLKARDIYKGWLKTRDDDPNRPF